MATKTKLDSQLLPPEIAARAVRIRELLDRLKVRRAPYQIDDRARGRISVGTGDSEVKADSHAVHLRPSARSK